VVVGIWLALRPERLESLAAAGLAAAAGGAIAGWAVTRPGIAHDVQPYSTRLHDGAIFGVVFVVGAVIVAVAAASLLRADAETPLAPERRSELARIALVAVGVLAVLLFAGSTVKAGGPGAWLRARAHEFTSNASVEETPGCVTSFSSNHRWAWWKESWSWFLDRPLEGTGAGSFVLVHRPRRSTSLDVSAEPPPPRAGAEAAVGDGRGAPRARRCAVAAQPVVLAAAARGEPRGLPAPEHRRRARRRPGRPLVRPARARAAPLVGGARGGD